MQLVRSVQKMYHVIRKVTFFYFLASFIDCWTQPLHSWHVDINHCGKLWEPSDSLRTLVRYLTWVPLKSHTKIILKISHAHLCHFNRYFWIIFEGQQHKRDQYLRALMLTLQQMDEVISDILFPEKNMTPWGNTIHAIHTKLILCTKVLQIVFCVVIANM